MTITINESGMTFGPFHREFCFHIEKSAIYRNIQKHLKIAEFLLLRLEDGKRPVVWIVEAKSSSPQRESQPDFDQYIGEVGDKFANALSLGIAVCLNRHRQAEAELPDPFKTLDLSVADFRLVLVVNGHQKAWLPPLRDALAKALHSSVKTWAISANAVVVLNEDLALKHRLIQKDV